MPDIYIGDVNNVVKVRSILVIDGYGEEIRPGYAPPILRTVWSFEDQVEQGLIEPTKQVVSTTFSTTKETSTRLSIRRFTDKATSTEFLTGTKFKTDIPVNITAKRLTTTQWAESVTTAFLTSKEGVTEVQMILDENGATPVPEGSVVIGPSTIMQAPTNEVWGTSSKTDVIKTASTVTAWETPDVSVDVYAVTNTSMELLTRKQTERLVGYATETTFDTTMSTTVIDDSPSEKTTSKLTRVSTTPTWNTSLNRIQNTTADDGSIKSTSTPTHFETSGKILFNTVTAFKTALEDPRYTVNITTFYTGQRTLEDGTTSPGTPVTNWITEFLD